MRKKKIAIFVTGWAAENLYHYLRGVKEALEGMQADCYLFLCHPTFSDSDTHFKGEVNIFRLPNLEEFDGALVFANGIDYPEVIGYIKEYCEKTKLPVVYTGNDKLGGYFVGSDNYVGAKDLCDHLITVHGARKFLFIAGSRENMDSNTRMQTLKDALEEIGEHLDEENICYSNWGPTNAVDFVKKRIGEGYIPDAIVCANDVMAMILCSELNDMGYPVPDRIMVTGFDNESYAQIYDPALASVDQRFDLIGKQSMQTLGKAINHEPCEKAIKIPCEFVANESCGCKSACDMDALRKALGKNKFLQDTRGTVFDQNLSMMEREIMSGKSYISLKKNFETIQRGFRDFQGDSFHIVLEPMFEKFITNPGSKLRTKGYSERMDAIFSICDGNIIRNDSFASKELIPQVSEDGKNHFYILMPLHEENLNMGYLVFVDDIEKTRNGVFLCKYVERLNIILGKYLRDLRVDVLHGRLLELTETDALTHVKNRMAYEARVESIQKRMDAGDEFSFAVAVFDVNDLKRINDYLGHEAGDEYIISSCKLICDTFKKSRVYRIGGDEFAVILEGVDYDNRQTLLEEMRTEMERLRTADLPDEKRVSLASGLAIYESDKHTSFEEIFGDADACMYENKAKMKKRRK